MNSRATVFVATGFDGDTTTFQWRYVLANLRKDLKNDFKMSKFIIYEIVIPKAIREDFEAIQSLVEKREGSDLYAGHKNRKPTNIAKGRRV